jgi:hypothetical protein
MLGFLACMLPKMSSYLSEGRFWAEEASVFFGPINASALKVVTFLYGGQLLLATNVTVWAATMVDFERAPLVTTYGGLLQLCVPIALIIWYQQDLGLRPLWTCALLVVIAGLPQMPEVLANATCLQFHMLLVVSVIAVLPPRVIEATHARWMFRGLLLWAGLSGVPPNCVVPVLLALAVYERSRERWVQFGLLAATALLQAGLLLLHWESVLARQPQNVPLIAWFAFESQVIIAPLYGVASGTRLSEVLRSGLRGEPGALMFAVWLMTPAAAVVAVLWRQRAQAVWSLGAVCVITTTLSVTFSLTQDKSQLIHPFNGGRYFFVPSVLWYLLVAKSVSVFPLRSGPGGAPAHQALRVGLAVYLLAVSLACMVFRPSSFFTSGTPWRAALREAKQSGSSTVQVWPDGWEMPIPNNLGSPTGPSQLD